MKGGLQAYSQTGARRLRQAGFTIVEVMIVLAVTGILFVSAAALISGRQDQAAFDQGIQQLQSEFQQTINDVATGFYPNLGDFVCKDNGGTLAISTGTAAQGTNGDCLFLGKVLEFGTGVSGSSPEQFATLSLAGLRADSSGNTTTSLPSTSPTVIPSSTETTQLEGGLSAVSMWYNGNRANSIAALAFVSSLGQTTDGVLSGTQQVNIVPITGTALTQNSSSVTSAIQSVLASPAAIINPSGGVEICFASGGTNQSGLVTIGNSANSGRELGVTLNVKSGRSC